jgi:hypothetical protein
MVCAVHLRVMHVRANGDNRVLLLVTSDSVITAVVTLHLMLE